MMVACLTNQSRSHAYILENQKTNNLHTATNDGLTTSPIAYHYKQTEAMKNTKIHTQTLSRTHVTNTFRNQNQFPDSGVSCVGFSTLRSLTLKAYRTPNTRGYESMVL